MAPRLWPEIPRAKYACFYPMDRRRGESKNWYEESLADRQRMMEKHGAIGRRYAGEVRQIISGSIGLDDWEWGVDLFSEDPAVFKRLIYEMRFDEVSAVYALFGRSTSACACRPPNSAGSYNFEQAIHIIGGGLAGTEAAWQIARRGMPCVLHEMRPVRPTPAHQTDRLAELVCSNSLKSESRIHRAVAAQGGTAAPGFAAAAGRAEGARPRRPRPHRGSRRVRRGGHRAPSPPSR